MIENTPENSRRLSIVPLYDGALRTASTSVEAQPDAQRCIQEVGQYAAYVQIGWPEGVARHPNTGKQVMRRLGCSRICGIDHDSEHLGLTYALVGDSVDDAQNDADEVLDIVLGWLGFGRSAVRYAQILNVRTPQA